MKSCNSNSLLQFLPRLIKDTVLLLNCFRNYIRTNRQQSPSIRGRREGALLFQWSHKVLNESSSASSWGIKNRREQLTSSYSRFLRNWKCQSFLRKSTVWSDVAAHMLIACWEWLSNVNMHPCLPGPHSSSVRRVCGRIWYFAFPASQLLLVLLVKEGTTPRGLLGWGTETGGVRGLFQKQKFEVKSPSTC